MALRNAARILPDLVLLDVTMPEMDGFEVCRRLRQEPATLEIPVIFITARDTKEDLIAGFEAGGLDYIAKPFQEEEVLVRVRTHVRLHQLARELVHKNEELEHQIAHSQQLSGRLSMLAEREVAHWAKRPALTPTLRGLSENPKIQGMRCGLMAGTGYEY